MKTFLSWDCASKTLAHAYITVNTNVFADIHALVGALRDAHTTRSIDSQIDIITKMLNILNSAITIHSAGVTDILEGRKVKDVTDIEKTRALRKFLTSRDIGTVPAGVTVLIEHQPSKIGMAANNQSTQISAQLAYHYIDRDPVLVDPRLKNKITITAGYEFENYLAKSSSKYLARKNHTKHSLLYYVQAFDCPKVISHVPRSQLDDLADAFFQIFAYLRYCKH
jgi:hypothetical protein